MSYIQILKIIQIVFSAIVDKDIVKKMIDEDKGVKWLLSRITLLDLIQILRNQIPPTIRGFIKTLSTDYIMSQVEKNIKDEDIKTLIQSEKGRRWLEKCVQEIKELVCAV